MIYEPFYETIFEVDPTPYVVEFFGKLIVLSYMILIVVRAFIWGDKIYERY